MFFLRPRSLKLKSASKSALGLMTILLLLLTSNSLTAQAAAGQGAGASQAQNSSGQAPADFNQILMNIDRSTTFENDLSARITLEEKDPKEGNTSSSFMMFRRDREDKFLMLIQRPESQLGQGYLRVDDNLWFYDPESRKFQFSSMSEAFQGSDARNSDFRASSLAEDYVVESWESAKLGSADTWVLRLKAKNNEVTYPFRTIWVSKRDQLMLKTEDYSLTKRLLRVSYFPSYAKLGDRYLVTKAIFSDALVQGKSTTLIIEQPNAARIPDSVFTKAYVESVNN